jgi:hypothetical protein
MSKLTPIYVRLKKGRHKTQPWTFTIDRPGAPEGETKRQRYVTMTTAWRGARRMLRAMAYGTNLKGETFYVVAEKGGRIRPVKRIIDQRK